MIDVTVTARCSCGAEATATATTAASAERLMAQFYEHMQTCTKTARSAEVVIGDDDENAYVSRHAWEDGR